MVVVIYDGLRPTAVRSDIIVVMGAAQYNGRPSPVLAARLDTAIGAYRDHLAPTIVTVGGRQSGDQFTEAAAGRTYLIARGVPATAIVAIGVGSDTLQSVRAVAQAADARHWHTVVVVSDPWHLARSTAMFRYVGMSPSRLPAASGPSRSRNAANGIYIAREALGLAYFQLFHSDALRGPIALH